MIYTKEQLQEVRNNLFDTANSLAGDVTGDVAVMLHDASNGVQWAVNTLEKGKRDKTADERYQMHECTPVVHSQAILSGWKQCPYCNKEL